MEQFIHLLGFIMGIGLTIYSVRAWKTGEVRAGHNFGTPIFYTRQRDFLLFHVFVLIYLAGGVGMAGYTVLAMGGVVPMIPVN